MANDTCSQEGPLHYTTHTQIALIVGRREEIMVRQHPFQVQLREVQALYRSSPALQNWWRVAQQCLQRAPQQVHSLWARLRSRKSLPLVAKIQEDMALKASRPKWLCCKDKNDTTTDAREADYQKPAGSSDISADADRKRWCSGTRWDEVLFSSCQPRQRKPTDLMFPSLSPDALTLQSLWKFRICHEKGGDGR